jgi:signal transduction histidine kinase
VRGFSVVGRVLPDVETSLWRALAVYRVLVFGYAVVVVVGRWGGYAHPLSAGLVLAAMALWTSACTWAYSSARRRSLPMLGADLAVACGAVLLTVLVETSEHIKEGAPTLPTLWASASVLAWAVRLGVAGGAVAAAGVSAANLVVRPDATPATLANIFLVFLAGIVVGYVSNLVLAAEAERTRAAEFAAATGERERLARGIHDGVLQVLALVQRRGREMGGEAAELGRLAGEQERILRALVAGEAVWSGGAAPPCLL